jgi:signal transduction histidine kinase
MFDRDLKPLKIKTIVKEDVPIVLLNNSYGIWGAGEWPYLLVCTPTRLLAYDKELNRKILDYTFERPFPSIISFMSASFVPGKTKQGNDAFVSAGKLYHLYESKFSPGKILKNLVTSGLLYTIIILLLFNGIYIYFTFGLKKPIFPSSRQEGETEAPGFLEILQGIAHQLKNPISTILWTAEKIKRSSAENTKKNTLNSYRQLSDFLLEDVATLRKQTGNMLKMIRIQKPRFRQKNLKPLLEQLVEQYRTTADEKTEIRLQMEEDISLYIDDELFKDAIVILIENAVDAVPEGGKLSISVTSVPPLPDSKGRIRQVSIEVENTGRGMDENERSQAFTPLFSKKEKDSDIGLDITICRQIIEAHEGKLELQRRNGFGMSAKLIIPLKKETARR